METFVLFFVTLLVDGVFGFTDEMKTVWVMEGDSVTLSTSLTEIQKGDLLLWTFGSDSTRIVQINRMANKISLYDDVLDGRFRDRLKVDHQTGSLTITNTTTKHTGLYRFLQIVDGKEVLSKKFSIIVSAPLSVPVISRNSSHCSSSSSSCSLVCSVVNVGHVTLSWFKGNSVLSSFSVSDLSISLSLSLEVDYQEKNTYSCVLNNSFTNHTTHLDISRLCHTCSAPGLSTARLALVCVCALAVAVVLCGIYYYCQHKTRKQADKGDEHDREELTSLTSVVSGNNGDVHQPNHGDGETSKNGGKESVQEEDLETSVHLKEDKISSVPVTEGQFVTLQTDLTEIQEINMICWTFADSKERSCAKFALIARLNKTNNEVYLCDDIIQQFKDSLKLNLDTGSLTITNIKPEHYGYYKQLITSKEEMVVHTFSVDAHNLIRREQTQSVLQRSQTCP